MSAVVRWDEEDGYTDGGPEPQAWIAPDGSVWDLTAGYCDRLGHFWHWAGGFVSEHDYGYGYVPIMSRNDWAVQDLSLSLCPHPMTKGGKFW